MSVEPPRSTSAAELSVFDARAGARAESSTFLLGQVMFLVAIALAFAAAGTYLGRNLSFGTAEICWFGTLGMLIAQMFVPTLREGPVGMTWMFALALLLGLGMSPMIAHYATVDRTALYQAAGGTALTVGIMGSYGFATSRNLIRWMRPLFFALLGVFALSLILILVGSGEHLVLNLAIYAIVAAYLAIYFQIIRRQATERDVVWLATGVFINIINIFLTLLRIFGNSR
ncbi:MAG TPA: Bax inhibitor-1 family protein [Solirubrobacteraceae bacterium]|jgi:modulator of FtsH protease|nr:Bax inhibitor-1 family protein [Solirubrobacteraceae bacterium]